jgi:hypothetical protein
MRALCGKAEEKFEARNPKQTKMMQCSKLKKTPPMAAETIWVIILLSI